MSSRKPPPRSLWVVLVALAACHPGPAPAPEAAYRAFVTAYAKGDADAAWALVSSGTQAALTRAAQEAAAAEHVKPPKDGELLMFQGDVLPQKIKDVSVGEKRGDRVELAVTDDAGGQEKVSLVREQGKWRVDLTAELAHAAR